MKTAKFSLVIAIVVAVLSLLQFDRYQTFINSTHANLTALENKTNLTLARFKDDLAKLNTAQEAILTRTQNPTFKTAELEYLIRLANTQLEATRDVKGATKLLTLAQTKIQNLNDTSLTPLSDAIAKDLTALQQATIPNLEDLWLKVSAVIDQTNMLLPQTITPNTNAEKEKTLSSQEKQANMSRVNMWKQRFFESLEAIKDLVKIRHSTQSIEPILSEAQKNLVQENLRSLLEQVRVAILTTENKIYQQALQDTQQWLSRYYGDANPTIKDIQSTLTTLSTINLRPTLPNMTAIEFFNTLR